VLHKKTYIHRIENKDVHSKNVRSKKRLRSKTYWVGRAVYPEHLGALLVADPPTKDVLRAGYHLRLGDLALCDSGRVRLPPILEGWVGPVLERLDETTAEADGHRMPVSPSALSCCRSSSKGLSSLVSSVASWLVHSKPTTGTLPVLDFNASTGLSR
jgi:hypothetical protein